MCVYVCICVYACVFVCMCKCAEGGECEVQSFCEICLQISSMANMHRPTVQGNYLMLTLPLWMIVCHIYTRMCACNEHTQSKVTSSDRAYSNATRQSNVKTRDKTWQEPATVTYGLGPRLHCLSLKEQSITYNKKRFTNTAQELTH